MIPPDTTNHFMNVMILQQSFNRKFHIITIVFLAESSKRRWSLISRFKKSEICRIVVDFETKPNTFHGRNFSIHLAREREVKLSHCFVLRSRTTATNNKRKIKWEAKISKSKVNCIRMTGSVEHVCDTAVFC